MLLNAFIENGRRPHQPRRVASVAALTNLSVLSELLDDDVVAVRIDPLAAAGYSNASLWRMEIQTGNGERGSLVLKRNHLDQDWIRHRTKDVAGREAVFLNEADFAAVWDIFLCPYVAFAAGPEVGLLMHDVTSGLLPDAREPLTEDQELLLLGTLARLHAQFWDSSTLELDWLMRPAQFCDLLAPSVAHDARALAVLSSPLQEAVSRGWALAMAQLPETVARHLTVPGREWEMRWADLPCTLLHGDVKIANFALFSDRSVTAFDWAMLGAGPCAIDVGWYLAVNASRLTASKETVLTRYRAQLEHALGKPVPDGTWRELEDAAVITGARMLLWSKAVALDVGRPGSVEEWSWWVDRLAAV